MKGNLKKHYWESDEFRDAVLKLEETGWLEMAHTVEKAIAKCLLNLERKPNE